MYVIDSDRLLITLDVTDTSKTTVIENAYFDPEGEF